jgi:hypothetical protein
MKFLRTAVQKPAWTLRLATIFRANIQSSLNYLAADEREGRMTGSRGYDESAQYVADQFAAIGLEPGGTDGWLQQVPFITRMTDIENSGVTLHKSNGDVDLEWEKDLILKPDEIKRLVDIPQLVRELEAGSLLCRGPHDG